MLKSPAIITSLFDLVKIASMRVNSSEKYLATPLAAGILFLQDLTRLPSTEHLRWQ